MTSILSRIFGERRKPRENGDAKFREAMDISSELLNTMRAHSTSNDPIRGVMADLWSHRHNVPFVTTVYEAAQEMKAATEQTAGPT